MIRPQVLKYLQEWKEREREKEEGAKEMSREEWLLEE